MEDLRECLPEDQLNIRRKLNEVERRYAIIEDIKIARNGARGKDPEWCALFDMHEEILNDKF